MLYLYALVEHPGEVGDLRGIQGERLELHRWQSAAVVVGEVAGKPPIASATLRAQDALVRELHDRADALLPMRFGTTCPAREAMERSLQASPGLLEKLAAVRGCEQMTLRVLAPASADAAGEATAAKSGTEYLMARARRRQPSPALWSLADCARGLARDVRIEAGMHPGVRGSVYHLIARGAGGAYRDVVARAASELPELRVLVSGPSPPYAFA